MLGSTGFCGRIIEMLSLYARKAIPSHTFHNMKVGIYIRYSSSSAIILEDFPLSSQVIEPDALDHQIKTSSQKKHLGNTVQYYYQIDIPKYHSIHHKQPNNYEEHNPLEALHPPTSTINNLIDFTHLKSIRKKPSY